MENKSKILCLYYLLFYYQVKIGSIVLKRELNFFESFDLASENSSTRRQPFGIQLKSPQSSPSMRSYDLGNGVELRKPKLGRVG